MCCGVRAHYTVRRRERDQAACTSPSPFKQPIVESKEQRTHTSPTPTLSAQSLTPRLFTLPPPVSHTSLLPPTLPASPHPTSASLPLAVPGECTAASTAAATSSVAAILTRDDCSPQSPVPAPVPTGQSPQAGNRPSETLRGSDRSPGPGTSGTEVDGFTGQADCMSRTAASAPWRW